MFHVYCKLTVRSGCRRVWRDSPHILPRERRRLYLPPLGHGEEQRHKHRLFLFSNSLW